MGIENQFQQQLIPQPLLVPINEINQEKYIVNQYSKTKLKGSFLKGFSESFPYELTNVMAPQDYQSIIKDINGISKTNKIPIKGFFGLLVVSITLLFFSPLAFVVIFPIAISLITVSLICIQYFSKRIEEKIEKTLINFNNVFSIRRVNIELSKKCMFLKTKVKIVYPASLAIQPVMYNIQPIQQAFYQQPTTTVGKVETTNNEDTTSLLSKV
ncbi:hypothetical protein ACTFIY_011265 [Dictyostelium cf. discoideum]